MQGFLRKAQSYFVVRPIRKTQSQKSLYNSRKEQSSEGNSLNKKLNINLIFNTKEYASVPDDQNELKKRKEELQRIMQGPNIKLEKLKSLAWNGIQGSRAICWKILLNVLSTDKQKHEQQSRALVERYLKVLSQNDVKKCERTKLVDIDLARTFTQISLFSNKSIVSLLHRVLCLWDITGKGGYLQGMSDLAGILLLVLMGYDEENTKIQPQTLSQADLQKMQAELYFMCYAVFDKFFSYYTIGEAGRFQQVLNQITFIINKADECLGQHFKQHGVELIQFAFRWIYVMLSRQLPLKLIFRLWDSYFATSEDFHRLHSFVVSSLVLRFSLNLLKLNSFGEIIKTLQQLPTNKWSKKDVEMLVQEAIVLQHIFSEKLQQ